MEYFSVSADLNFSKHFLEARGVAQWYSGALWSRSAKSGRVLGGGMQIFVKTLTSKSFSDSDEDGYLIRSRMINANSKIVRERIVINRFAIEIEFQPLYPDPGALLHEASDTTLNFVI